ncbi:MAG: hypothetical protein E7496_08450 [Ruminococcus sp.]|nr:hypothetical protein [Ruminococcus sp.]
MKIKPKGRKIYRRKDRIAYHKKIRHDTGSAVLTILIAGVIGFFGYSAGAPVLKFLQERELLSPPSAHDAETVFSETAQAETFPEADSASVSAETVQESAVPETESVPETEPETEEENLGFVQKAPSVQGYLLEASALMTESSLHSALEELPEGISHLLIPLKLKGGNIYYATSVQDAARSNAVQAFIPLSDIYQAVSAKGIEPVALINMLEDSVFPKSYPDAGYLFQDTGDFWTDKSASEGTLWLSPFSVLTQDYLSAIAEEIETAGFRTIVCDGLKYPNFPRTELPELDPRCSEPERWQYLTDVLTAMRAKASETAFFVRIDGNDTLLGNTESLSAAEAFPADCLLVSGNPETLQDLEQFTEISNSVPVILEYHGSEIPKNLKLKSYILNPQE